VSGNCATGKGDVHHFTCEYKHYKVYSGEDWVDHCHVCMYVMYVCHV
jgi:hypothetical protein